MTTRSVPAGSLRSACQTIAGSCPETSRSVRAMSRSRLMPGKTRTAEFMDLASAQNLDPIVLDHGIGQQLVGGLLEQSFGLGPVGALKLDVEDLALAHAGDAVDAERAQCAFDRLALRIEDAGFQGDGDAGLQNLNPSPAPARCRAAARSRS